MTVLIILVCIFVLLLIYCRIEPLMLKTTGYCISSKRIPDELDQKRLLLLTDLHNTAFGKDNCKLKQMVKDASADMIVISGDLINGNSSQSQFVYAYSFLEFLKSLEIPVFYTFGNHECRLDGCYYNVSTFKNYREQCDKYVKVLNNESICPEQMDQTVIYGVMFPDDQYKRKLKFGLTKPISEYIGEPDNDKYNILIAHDPSYIKEYSDWGADLVLCGHLHGGIFRLPFIGGLISPRYTFFPKPDKGLFDMKNSGSMVVSGGIGWHGLPLRFLNRPEIVTIDFRKEDIKDESSDKA